MRVRGSIATLVVAAIGIIDISSSSVPHHDKSKLRGGDPSSIDTISTVTSVNNNNHVDMMINHRSLKTKPTRKPTPTRPPTQRPSRTPKPTVSPCVSFSTYDAIDNDIENMKNSFTDAISRGRFLGGIVRLVAHDFMDYDVTNTSSPMGPDGCFDAAHPANIGLNTIWCSDCPLRLLHKQKYSHISKADFWVAAANAVIRQTSVDNALDLRGSFLWGRKDIAACPGAGSRIPKPSGCTSVEDVFLKRMGLTWRDAVVLMGAHALGRSNGEFSGHDGLWKDTEEDAQIFDKQYYDEIFTNSWQQRNIGEPNQDWTTGYSTDPITRLMLNTDLCLVFDIDDNTPCCTGDACVELFDALSKCPMLSNTHTRYEALETVEQMRGGSELNTNNLPFYDAFSQSWNKATTIGWSNLFPLQQKCP